jgi:hypothetical protein
MGLRKDCTAMVVASAAVAGAAAGAVIGAKYGAATGTLFLPLIALQPTPNASPSRLIPRPPKVSS